MKLYLLTNSLWEFNFSACFEYKSPIPGKSLWKFNLEGYLEFEGNTFGEGHPILQWSYGQGNFYVQSHYRYGLIEFKIDKKGRNLLGRRINEDNSVTPFKATSVDYLPKDIFYDLFAKILSGPKWKLLTLGTIGQYFFEFFHNNQAIRYNIKSLKEIVEQEPYGYDEIINHEEYEEYIYHLEKQKVFLIDKSTNQCIGKFHLDNSLNLKGVVKFSRSIKTDFIQLSPIYEYEIKEVIKEIN